MRRVIAALAAIALLALGGCGNASHERVIANRILGGAPTKGSWVAVYGAAMQGTYRPGDLGNADRWFPGGQAKNQTFRVMAPLTGAGQRLRVVLSNRFGNRPVTFARVSVARRSRGATLDAGTSRSVTFGGHTAVTAAPGRDVTSDPVTLDVTTGTDLAVSIDIRGATGPMTWHYTQPTTSYVSAPGSGDHTADVGPAAFPVGMSSVFWLTEVDVRAEPRETGAIVAIGDSITDGSFLPQDRHARWTDALARRLRSRATGSIPTIVNSGIGGGRLLRPGLQFASPSAQDRFGVDVLKRAGVRTVVLELGINDIANGATPARVETVLTRLAARAHAAKLLVLAATLTPTGGAALATNKIAAIEANRQTVNRWIRTASTFDGVLDFDRVLRDPADPTRLNPAFDSGDHIHPNRAGDKALADSVDLPLVTR